MDFEATAGKMAADFIARNIENTLSFTKDVWGTLDESIKLKLKTAYKDYLENVQLKYSKSKSFFNRDQSVYLYSYYVPMGIYNSLKNIDSPTFPECHESLNNFVIKGLGGSGKSILMKHLFLSCIKSSDYIPVFIELRDFNESRDSLIERMDYTLQTFGLDVSEDYLEKARKTGHFCLFLDGYDEVDHEFRRNITNDVRRFINKYPRCPVILSTRPDDDFRGVEELNVMTITPLDLEKATELVQKLEFEDKEIKEKFIEKLNTGLFLEHESFLSNPLLLSIMLLTFGENAEIPTKLSVFYNQAYEALFNRHDANKGGFTRKRKTRLDTQDFSKVFSLFCLLTYDKSMYSFSRTQCLDFIDDSKRAVNQEFSSEDYLDDLLSAVCLLNEDGLEITFTHRSFQEYFVALYISKANSNMQCKLIDKYYGNRFGNLVFQMLYEMNSELIEERIFLNYLNELYGCFYNDGVFDELAFVRKYYSKARFHENGLLMLMPNSDVDVAHKSLNWFSSQIPQFEAENAACRRCMKENGPDLFVKFKRELSIKKRNKKAFITHVSRFSDEHIKELVEKGMLIGVRRFVYMFEPYLELKQKHETNSKDLEELLELN